MSCSHQNIEKILGCPLVEEITDMHCRKFDPPQSALFHAQRTYISRKKWVSDRLFNQHRKWKPEGAKNLYVLSTSEERLCVILYGVVNSRFLSRPVPNLFGLNWRHFFNKSDKLARPRAFPLCCFISLSVDEKINSFANRWHLNRVWIVCHRSVVVFIIAISMLNDIKEFIRYNQAKKESIILLFYSRNRDRDW